MKKIICIMIAVLCICVCLTACTRDSDIDSRSIDDFIVATGGKKYEIPISGAGSDYYTNGKAVITDDGIQFSGTGGFYTKENGDSGAGCGGIFKTGIDMSQGNLKVEFIIDEAGHYCTTQAGGIWDTWFSFGLCNKTKMFNTASVDSSEYAQGYIALLKPFEVAISGANFTVQTFDRSAGWNGIAGENPQTGQALNIVHTYELIKDSDELGVFYTLKFDGNDLKEISESDFNDVFDTGLVYIQMHMQSWNAAPLESDTEEEKTFKENKFTIKSITVGDTKLF